MLESWKVADAPPSVRVHGPLILELPNGRWTGELLRGAYAIADEDIQRASTVFTSASRCISIENLAVFREVAGFYSGDLLVHTSYPSRAVTRLLARLPHAVKLYHWGDTDPWGYDILRVLREKTGRAIHGLNMRFRPGPGPCLSKSEIALVERLIKNREIADLSADLRAMRSARNKGCFEQESLALSESTFPFANDPGDMS